jgi:hypothetical protein
MKVGSGNGSATFHGRPVRTFGALLLKYPSERQRGIFIANLPCSRSVSSALHVLPHVGLPHGHRPGSLVAILQMRELCLGEVT